MYKINLFMAVFTLQKKGNKEYVSALNLYSLKNGFISDSINILEIRSGLKEVYW